MQYIKETFKKIPILSKIIFFLLRIVVFFQTTLDIAIDKGKRHCKEADIRLSYIGHHTAHRNVSDQDFFFAFIKGLTGKRVAISWYKPSLIISSPYGNYLIYMLLMALLRFSKVPMLFFSGENLHSNYYLIYKNYLNGLPDQSLGFDYNSPYADRFPLWLMYVFGGDFIAKASQEDVKIRLKKIEASSFLDKEKFAAMIARHDGVGSVSRSKITKSLNKIHPVSCAGKLMHNDNLLMEKFKDNKVDYLKDFVFNICPENSSTSGYVTEKLLESFEAGCIPIYWGDSNPEPNIINHKRIIFWQEDGDNKENLQIIKKLYEDEGYKKEFLKEPIFIEDADKATYNYFLILRRKITSLLESGA
jgi:alpha(1,3/1,4) fucosyltransferase